MDEVSLGAATMVGELKDGKVSEYEIHPEDFGLSMASNRSLKVDDAAQSQALIDAVLANESGAARDIVMLNAGVALYAADIAKTMTEGVVMARDAIASGRARAKREQFVAAARGLAPAA
jgi:anthranilate phosphoribosyltransferase